MKVEQDEQVKCVRGESTVGAVDETVTASPQFDEEEKRSKHSRISSDQRAQELRVIDPHLTTSDVTVEVRWKVDELDNWDARITDDLQVSHFAL